MRQGGRLGTGVGERMQQMLLLPAARRRGRGLHGPAGLAGAMDEGSMISGRRPSAGEEAVEAGSEADGRGSTGLRGGDEGKDSRRRG